MARHKDHYPGDLVYVAPSYAKDRPWAREWVGVAAIVIGQYQDGPWSIRPGYYLEVVIDGKEYLIDVCDVQLEPVRPDWES